MAAVELERVEYTDEFSEQIQTKKPLTLDEVVRTANRMQFPSWIGFLFSIRDSIVRSLGIKTRDDYRPSSESKSSVMLFPILQQSNDSIIAGDDDRHLNFRVIIKIIDQGGGTYRLSFRTLVQFNNILGKAYFIPVKPIHKIIVPAMLKRLSMQIASGMC